MTESKTYLGPQRAVKTLVGGFAKDSILSTLRIREPKAKLISNLYLLIFVKLKESIAALLAKICKDAYQL